MSAIEHTRDPRARGDADAAATPPGASGPGLTRWQAAGIHLGISAVVAAVVMGVLFLLWYPSTYFTAMGGEQLVYLLVGCDVVLGPLITLIIYKHGKRGLKFDLAVIGFLQAAALTYGVMIAAGARPVYTVFVVDRFEVTAANDIDPKDVERVKDPQYRTLSWTGPKTVAALKPTNADDQLEMIVSGLGGKDMNQYPHLFVPYAQMQEEAARRAQPLSTLRRLNAQRLDVLDTFLRRHNVKDDDVGFLPMKAKRDARAVIVNRKGDILGILALQPW